MQWLTSLLFALVRWPTRWLVKANHIPSDIYGELGITNDKPIIYLLKTHSLTDVVALQMVTQKMGLPDPAKGLSLLGERYSSCLYLEKPQSLIGRQPKNTLTNDTFVRLFQAHRKDQKLDVQIVPVSIFWGRAPGKSKPGWTDLLADRASPNWLRKLFIVLFLGRDNFVYFSPAVSSRDMAERQGSDKLLAQKLIRVARTHFFRRQQAVAGPRQMERYQLRNSILGSDAVRSAMDEEAKNKKISQDKARQLAVKYFDEIAADYRDGLVRLADRILTRVWNKIYRGIEVHHADKVRELARNGHEIVYVPCHRSHMDYLLLTYSIYHQGLMTPHIAAGINLNFWPVGGIFRRAGAFFLRRSFGGNKLYTAVFREYLEQLFNRGYPVKYYPEGGRSRTGRLLPPKTGMFAMTLQAMLKGINRPVSIVPVYIGYEHVMEVKSYLGELKGRNKQKESVFGIFAAIRKLRNYGIGLLNFGDPINLTQYLDREVDGWRASQAEPDKKPAWLTPTVNQLALDVMRRINQASAVSGLSLCALALLGTKRKAMADTELVSSVEHFLTLLKTAPYSDLATLPDKPAKELVEQAIGLDKFTQTEDSFGCIISLDSQAAIVQTYYRNNILHMFVLPGMLAAAVIAENCSRQRAIDLVETLYPLLQKELFIYLPAEDVSAYCEKLLDAMVETGLLIEEEGRLSAPQKYTSEFYSLWLLNRTVQETLQRYGLVLKLLEEHQQINRGALEKQSQQLAARLSALHGLNAPEFYDKNVLATFIQGLRENNLITADESGQLQYTDKTAELQNKVMNLVSRDIAQSIERIRHQHQLQTQ